MRFRTYALALCFSAMPSFIVFAQSCQLTLKITVVETHNFAPVYPALVFVDELQKSFEANENGVIILKDLCTGNYALHIVASGYETFAERVAVLENTQTTIRLNHLESALQEVKVTDSKLRTIVQDKDELTRQELLDNSGKSIGQILSKINGVTMLTNGGTIAKPVIHGLHSNRIVMLNNGVRQEDQQWGGEHAPNIDPFLAQNITVVKGAASVRYGGDAIAGVVLVEPNALRNKPGWNGEINAAAFANNRMGVLNGMVEHRFKNIPLAFRLQGTFKKGGNYRIPGFWAANTGVEEANYSANAAYRRVHTGAEIFYSHFNTTLGLYRGSHTGNREDLLAAINSTEPLIASGFTYNISRPYQHVMHDLAKAKLYADTRIGFWNLAYAYQSNYRQEFDVQRIENSDAQLNITLNTQTINLNLDHKKIGRLSGQVGVDGLYKENYSKPGDRLFIPNYFAKSAGIYAIEHIPFGNVTGEGGLRYDLKNYDVYNAQGLNQEVVHYAFSYSNVSGTLGLKQQVKNNFEWSATLSNAWRAPQPNELFSAGFHQGAARIEKGNRNLQAERSYNLNLAAKHVLKEKFTTEISLYTQYINHYIFLEPAPDVLTIRGYFKTFNYRQTNANLSGVDATISYAPNARISTALKGSFLRGWNRKANDFLILMPADRLSFTANYLLPLNKQGASLNFGTAARYVFRQVRIPSNFDVLDFPRPPAAYFLLDATVGVDFSVKQQPLSISLSATNLLNEKYRDYLDAFRYFIDQPGRDVVLRLHIPFQQKTKN